MGTPRERENGKNETVNLFLGRKRLFWKRSYLTRFRCEGRPGKGDAFLAEKKEEVVGGRNFSSTGPGTEKGSIERVFRGNVFRDFSSKLTE